MPSSKKLLIVSCSAGSGHLRAAEALELACQKLYPDTTVRHIDLAGYLDKATYVYIVSLYNLSSNFLPGLYKLTYLLTDSLLIQKLVKITTALSRLLAKKFLAYMEDYQPDVIISTHYLPQLILPKKFSCPLDTVITDYYAHKVWLSPRVRNYFVATQAIKNDLAKDGIKSIASGIPIHPDFLLEKNSLELKNKLGIKNNLPTILILPATREKIKIKEVVSEILHNSQNKQINIVIINNKNNLKKLEAIDHAYLTLIPRANNIDEWMRVADIIVSKAGGLTITEAMHLQKPLIIINPIPGQEDHNTQYLEQNHFGIKANSAKEVASIVQTLLTRRGLIHKKKYPDASRIILETSLAL